MGRVYGGTVRECPPSSNVHPRRPSQVPSEDPLLNGVFAVEFTRGMQARSRIPQDGTSSQPHRALFSLAFQEGEDPRYLLAATTLKHFAAYSLEDYHDTANGIHYTRENINNVVSSFDLAGKLSRPNTSNTPQLPPPPPLASPMMPRRYVFPCI